ncbi:hypothetical protein WICPIJ_004334 [Wickerhamomyces pijperi]|uniref:Sedoheptulose 1,7-bisphosphatase n=1 Tax=Wickerhamomyces pijperi TaxID=599730 RepID=A0A9P8Q873_WICPI|nr:hypothetical protein WICPIJ_004334 [Wickerhamomyces pijperi]
MAKTACPRAIFVRHGQTEWSKSGQFTSITDLPLTDFGVTQMQQTGELLFQNGWLKSENVKYIFTSPRLRARQTVELILKTLTEEQRSKIRIVVDNDIREWEYGDYEGKLTKEIKQMRKEQGLNSDDWEIWRDGCGEANGETSKQVGLRLSRFIARVQNIHRKALEADEPCDVLVFAHGHTLRYFASLWFYANIPCEPVTEDLPKYVKSYEDDSVEVVEIEKYKYLNSNPNFLLDAGGVGVLSYSHHCIDEPALALSGVFAIPPEEESEHGK